MNRIDETDALSVGDRVEVRRRFDGAWTRGFEIAAIEGELATLRRRSDGAVLTRPFPRRELRHDAPAR